MRLVIDPAPFPALAGYRIGLTGETYAPDSQDLTLPDTDAQGHAVLTIALARAPDTTQALKAAITVGVNDPSGHASLAATEIPVRPHRPLIGIKPAFADDAVDAGTEAAFDIAAVSPDGDAHRAEGEAASGARAAGLAAGDARQPGALRNGLARRAAGDTGDRHPGRCATAYRAARSTSAAIGSRCWRTAAWRRPRSGSAPAGHRPTVRTCRTGWTCPPTRRTYAPGDTARIHIAPPFAGEATLLVLSDRVHAVRTLSVPEAGTDVEVPVDADWGTGAYATVHVFRPAADAKSRPGRAIGLAWVGVDPAARTLPLAIEAAEKYPPRARAAIRLRTAPGAWVSLAAVDEGILRLTKFASPDPSEHFLGRRQLGLDIRDDWGRLIAPPDGEATVLRQGGDEGSFALPDIPQRTVTLFMSPVQAGADGVRRVPARSARLQRPGAADGGGLAAAPRSARLQATSSSVTRWWPSRCCRASLLRATRRG